MKMVKEYSNCFKRLYFKDNSFKGTLVANTIRQFFSRLNPAIASLVYVNIIANL